MPPVYKLFYGFPLTNILHIVSLEKCPFYNIYLECTYDTNQKYLKIYFLIIYFKHILKTFLKKIFLLKSSYTYSSLNIQILDQSSFKWNKFWKIPRKTFNQTQNYSEIAFHKLKKLHSEGLEMQDLIRSSLSR